MASDRLWGDQDNKRVILDSSAVMMLFEFSIDLETQLTTLLGKYKIIVPKPIFNELDFLSKHGKGKKKLLAKPSLQIIKNYKILDSEKKGDDSVIYLAKKLNGIVLTNDKELIKRSKKLSLKVIYLRSKKKLVMQ